eukprot:TRINITY_DN10694_c0_g1_i1.p1 TRINITY_DN10694_c0_g1~~TRINITY_DN10694_c0_g1_i1.p1  ORF type:complete len:453 (-),score=118.22 TRINITY_DN10694_c0_g1_i1:46-1404(-)
MSDTHDADSGSGDDAEAVALAEQLEHLTRKTVRAPDAPAPAPAPSPAPAAAAAAAPAGSASRAVAKQSTGHKFWDTQPMLQKRLPDVNGPVEVVELKDVRKEPYVLPESFEWCEVKISDKQEMLDLYTLLAENYVEDDDNMFRFDYSVEFLQWALTPPGFRVEWHIGVRAKTGAKKLVAFISAIPATINVHGRAVSMVEINFLCVHKKLRSKRLAPVMIKEITRKVNLCDIWQAAYTAGTELPTPMASTRYYHRSLDVKKLVECRFTALSARQTLNRLIRLYALPANPVTPGLRPMVARDCARVTELLNQKLRTSKLAPVFHEADTAHWLLTRPNVITTCVVEDPASGVITDVISYYTLSSTVLGNDKHKTLRAAYCYYYATTKTPLEQLMNDMLIVAKKDNHDVFNALDLAENTSFIKELKFHPGDGMLHYYLYNWQCPEAKPDEVGLVLL